MAVNNERLYQLIDNAPAPAQNPQTAQAAAALAAAENEAKEIDYTHTADARLDRAINEALQKSGYNYDLSKDNNYQEFARQYSQNTLSGRESAQNTANQLSGGYAPTYADTVGSEVSHDIINNMANYTPALREAARQEAAAKTAQAATAAQIYHTLADTGYARNRDQVSDSKNYLNYLASRYGTERQAENQQQSFANDIYRSRLSNALDDTKLARKIDNAQYQLNSQSAESTAKLAAERTAFDQKMAYTAAKDRYDDSAAAAKATAKADKDRAKEIKTAKANYKSAADKIDKYVTSGKGLSYSEMKEFDYDGNGIIDERDRDLAYEASQTGNLQYEFNYSEGVNELISRANSQWKFLNNQISNKSEVKNKFINYLESEINKYKITKGEAAALYEAFWNKIK